MGSFDSRVVMNNWGKMKAQGNNCFSRKKYSWKIYKMRLYAPPFQMDNKSWIGKEKKVSKEFVIFSTKEF